MSRKQPVQQRSQATHAAIIEATIQVVVRDGVDHLTTGRVAERAGVSVGTLYQYFENKAALIDAVRTRHIELLLRAAAGALLPQDAGDQRTGVRNAIDRFLQFKRDHLALSRALVGLKHSAGDIASDFALNRAFAQLLLSLFPAALSESQRLAAADTLAAALDGAIGHAVLHAPDWLREPWYCDLLANLTLGCVPGGNDTSRNAAPAATAQA